MGRMGTIFDVLMKFCERGHTDLMGRIGTILYAYMCISKPVIYRFSTPKRVKMII